MSYVATSGDCSRSVLPILVGLVLASSVALGQPPAPPTKGHMLMEEGHTLLRARQLKEAYAKFEEAWSVANGELGNSQEDKLNLAIVQNVLGHTATQLGVFEKAIDHQRSSLDLKNDAFPIDEYPNGHEQLILGHRNLANALMLADQTKNAVGHHRIAADMATTLAKDGGCTPDMPAQCLLALAGALSRMGAYADALAESESALRIVEGLFPPSNYPNGHDALAGTMISIGTTRQAMGDFEGALGVFHESQAMIDGLHPLADETLTAQSLLGHRNINNNLGMLFHRMGDYAQARIYTERAVAVARRLHSAPEGHPSLARVLLNLALMQELLGENEDALKTLAEAKEILSRFFPESEYPNGHPRIARLLTNTAHVYQRLGMMGEAISLRKEVIEMHRSLAVNGGIDADLADALAQLGLTYAEAEDYEAAEVVLRESMDVTRAMLPADRYPLGHPVLVRAIANVGGCLLWLGRLEEGRDLLEEAADMNSRLYPTTVYPNGHPTARGLCNLLAAEAGRRGDRKASLAWQLQEQLMSNQLAKVNLAGLSMAESLNFAEAANLRMPGLLISQLSGTSDQEELVSVYQVVWDRRALVYRFARQRNQLARVAVDANDTLFSDYQRTNRMIARFSRQPIDTDRHEQFLSELKLLQDQKEQQEREINARIPGFLERLESAPASAKELRGRLPANAVLVDFVRYTRFEGGAPNAPFHANYGVFVITSARIKFVEIGQADQVEQSIQRAFAALANVQPVSDSLEELSSVLWDNLSPALPPEAKHLIICPDEAIAKVAWYALPIDNGQQLLERYTVTTIPHGESIVQASYGRFSDTDEAVDGQLLFVGDLDYGEPYKPYQPLPGTEYDPTLFGAKAESEVIKLVGQNTSVSSDEVLAALASADIAHLATHGFVYDAAPTQPGGYDVRARSAAGVLGTINAEVVMRNPYVGVGIACSHANRLEVIDRFLTGEEVAGSSFPTLRLAFLAICNSNRGRTRSGEGVFGLQRAFHSAGTETVVASLWRADDLSTRFITERFYYLLRKGYGPTDALRQAQQALADGELSEDARHPYFWAAWTVSGAPGSLPTELTQSSAPPTEAQREELSKTWLYYVLPLGVTLLCFLVWQLGRRQIAK